MGLWDAATARAPASLPDELLDTLVLAGDEADVRRRFEAFREARVDEPVAFLVSGQTDPDAVRAEIEATTAALTPRP